MSGDERLRLYRVEDVVTEVGVGWIRARSKAEAIEKAEGGAVEFVYGGGADVRRGDGLHAYVERKARP
jgi:hypothetical protein